MANTQFDLIIVGGSFAGLACARTAALRGLKVAVLDSKPEPGARVRTTGILVKEATDAFDIPSHLMRKVRGVRLYAPDERVLDLSAPGYYFQATDTAELMRWMAGEARLAGAHLLYGTPFRGARQTRDGIVLNDPDIAAKFLIGADGAKSAVARAFGLSRNRRHLIGLEIECTELTTIDPRFLHCFADSELAPGYIGWMVPGVGVTQIGLATTQRHRPDLAKFLARLRARFGLPELRILQRRSGLIPSGGPLRDLGRDRVLLIGDAAGLVSPVTGGGIHTALRYGRRAAQLVGDYLTDRGAHPVAAFAREIPRYRAKLAMRRVLDLAPSNFLISAGLMTAPARALAQRLYFHRRGGDPASFEAWASAFERGDYEPAPPSLPPAKLHCI